MEPREGPITRIPTEIQQLIIEQLVETSKKNLLNVSLISHSFNVLANKILLQKISLVISPRYFDSSMRLLRRLFDAGSLNALVRCITVDLICGPETGGGELPPANMDIILPHDYLHFVNPFGESVAYQMLDWHRTESIARLKTNMEQLLALWKLLPKCSGLRVFRWNPCMLLKPGILDTIRKSLPHCSIELAGFPLLRILSDDIQNLQTLAPNLTTLLSGVIPTARHGGYSSLDLLAPMKKLKKLLFFGGYANADHHCLIPPSKEEGVVSFPELEEVEFRNCEVREEDAEDWKNLMDWAQVKDISLNFTVLLRILQTDLTKVESFSISNHEGAAAADEDITRSFLLETNELHSLYMCGFLGVIRNDVLSHVGLTLTSLELLSGYGRQLSLAQIVQLGHYCKKLKYLALDIDLSGNWPAPTLEVLANNFHSVSHLELWVTITHTVRMMQINPVNIKREIPISHIWAYLWKEREKYRHNQLPGVSIARIQSLKIRGHADIVKNADTQEVIVELPFRLRSTTPLISSGQRLYRTGDETHFNIRLSERDDGIASGKAVITCQELEDYRLLVKEHGPFESGMKPRRKFVDCAVEDVVMPDEIGDDELGDLIVRTRSVVLNPVAAVDAEDVLLDEVA